ncbi:sulfite exporter TauE/SafE family protein [Corynebacterium vitaeruminis]|uniref:Probable membrane transporter protein n=1 Tax=Corynebacterium vitaeruminis DSM 20294 TaxID=1224164 RepID=W5YB14_9CORY|nr:sulfite exporter TauE/SafE family protein [Corynebacterium vitaeruminis]AHI23738.1 permease [Corynebacterium vitaeruminis DSM 20294]
MRTLIFIAIAGAAAQLVDGGLGMGFGVTSTTILILLAGAGPAQASAIVHAAEVGTTLMSGLAHWRFGNVDWKVVLKLGVPGAIAAFIGSTLLANLSTSAAKPVTSAILVAIGINLVWRFSKGRVAREVTKRTYSTPFLVLLGSVGGFVDASGGGGWGPVTTSTLMGLGRQEPRRIVGTVNTAEFLVSVAATLGFVVGLWDDLTANLAAVVALLIGGVITTPIAAFLISRMNPVALGGIVGSLIVMLNLPNVLALLGAGSIAHTPVQWGIQAAVFAVGVLLTLRGVAIARARRAEGQVSTSRSEEFEDSETAAVAS